MRAHTQVCYVVGVFADKQTMCKRVHAFTHMSVSIGLQTQHTQQFSVCNIRAISLIIAAILIAIQY